MARPSAAAPAPVPRLLAGYRPRPGVADELIDGSGAMRPVWGPMIGHLSALDPTAAEDQFARGAAYLRDAGVYFRQYSTMPQPEREWPLSPVPVLIHETEWRTICDGLAQRADLLEAVMADLYGPGALIRNGHLPAALIAGDPEWLRPMVGVAPASGHFLHVLSFEISRNPDGSWFVLGDRTQAPSGAGFALENRMAAARIYQEHMPRQNLHRLAGFFRTFLGALEAMPGRTAILTPGPANASYFEHTYIARYLGLLLLEGEDMIVENNAVMVRTVEGPQPLGTLWRRLDSDFADPLELREGSQIGTAGLVNALRHGKLAMINALGSGVLEMRAMMAFLPKIAEVLTGEPLRLPNIATWWCGQQAERAYVRANADRMMIGGALDHAMPFDVGAATAGGDAIRDGARDSVEAWIDAEGAALVGQELVTLSTTPAWEDGALVPRPMTVRVVAARTAGGWAFMPGGYARIGRSDEASALAMQRGGSVADVWVLSDTAVPDETLLAAGLHRTVPEALPSRAAENLFWLGRYTERTETGFRLMRAWHLRLAEGGAEARPDHLAAFMRDLGIEPEEAVPVALAQLVDAAAACAGKVRDRFSTDAWAALHDLSRTVKQLSVTVREGDDGARAMAVLLRKIAGFSGLVHENMVRTMGWRFLAMGRAVERCDGIALVLEAFARPEAPQGACEMAIELGDSILTHRRRYRGEASPESVIDLLALDPDNPRSILFQLSEMRDLARTLPPRDVAGGLSAMSRALLPLWARLSVAEASALGAAELATLRRDIADFSDLLSAEYLR